MASSPSQDSVEKVDVQHDNVAKKFRLPKTAEEKQRELDEALAIDPGPATISLAALQLYLVTLVACFCSGDNGFDSTVMGGINGMEQFRSYFGLADGAAKTSIVFGIYTIGSLTGTIPASYLPDRFGRRFPMFVGNIILIGGAALTANSKNMTMFLLGRWMTGMGCTVAATSAKSYVAEIAPAKHRGAFLGVLNSFYYIGQLAASGMMVSTGNFKSEYSWRLPLYIQMIPAALNLLFIWFCPESPRWLCSVARFDDARIVLAKYHSATNNLESPIVKLELEEIREKISVDGADKSWWDFRPLFRSAADRYRTYMVILIGVFGQLSGNGMITYFLPVLLKNAGIQSQQTRLVLNFVNSLTSFAGALGGTFTVDRFGRRTILLWGTVAITCILAMITGLLSSEGTSAQANTGIAFIFIFGVVYSFGWTAMQALYPAEVLGYEARAKGLAFLNICTQGSSCINTFGLPVALERITWKVYLIFTIWDAFECVMIYFFVAETKGLTLEEVDEVFHDHNPKSYSLELVKRRRARQIQAA
ncbi:general substrate transporter [Cylindrobasidium torrendii FP15055 ss-10]|uniref:General substrate transporter n=1 Tax=Cylindrobasidium torrendii FP15055 ss-10 TaxID=1314674 RepID=A0A0D7BA50_9AGAR|nr:general substrate transporter [Cylindrobasidium torrendii FP15055 ss-10]